MILINIKMPIRPEKMDEWLVLADSTPRMSTLRMAPVLPVRRSLTDENEFIVIEGFKDAEAGATHVKQPYVKRFFDAAPDLVAAQPRPSTSTRRMTASVRSARSSLADR